MEKIDVLHINDVAGAPALLSHFHKKFGLGNSLLVYRKTRGACVASHYDANIGCERFRYMVVKALKIARNFDVIHLHSIETLIPLLKLFTRKKIVLHYHGSDINHPGRSKNIIRIICRSMADMILYNQELHKEKIRTITNVKRHFIENGTDTDMFFDKNSNKKNTLAFISSNLDKKKSVEFIRKTQKKHSLELDIIDTDDGFVPHDKLPDLLNKYEFFIDIKVTNYGLFLKDELSNLATQALACGCNVYHDFGNGVVLIQEIPKDRKPEFVLKKLFHLYQSIL